MMPMAIANDPRQLLECGYWRPSTASAPAKWRALIRVDLRRVVLKGDNTRSVLLSSTEVLAVSAARRGAREGIKAVKFLQKNWDGYGAAPIDKKIIRAASKFIDSFPSTVTSAPSVVPMTRGRLQFEWHRGRRSLEIEFETPEKIHYLKYDGATGLEDEGILNASDASGAFSLTHWFFS